MFCYRYVVKGHYRALKSSKLADDNTLPDSTSAIVSSVEDIVRTIIDAGCIVYLVAEKGKRTRGKGEEARE